VLTGIGGATVIVTCVDPAMTSAGRCLWFSGRPDVPVCVYERFNRPFRRCVELCV